MKVLRQEYGLLLLALFTFIGLGIDFANQNVNITLGLTAFLGLIIGVILAFSHSQFLLKSIIFLVPLSIVTQFGSGLTLSLPAEGLVGFLALIICIKIMGGLKLDKSILYHPLTIFLTLEILWMYITSMNSSLPIISFKRTVLKTGFFFVFFVILAHYFNHSKKFNQLLFLYSLGLIIPLLSTLINHAGTNFSQEASFTVCHPFFNDHTIYGACLAFLVPFFFILVINKNIPFNQKIFFSICLGILALALLFSYSRAAWMSVLVAIGFYGLTLLKIKFRTLSFLILIAVGIFTINFSSLYISISRNDATKDNDNVAQHFQTVTNLKNNASNLERINRWVSAYRMFEEKPLTGFGPGMYQFEYARFQSNEFMTIISTHAGDGGNAHSEYLTALSEGGIFALILFLATILWSLYIGLKNLYIATDPKVKVAIYGFLLGLITFYVHGLFNTYNDYEKMSILTYGSMAGLVAIDIFQGKQIKS